ncbi:MAG: glycosyltransferase [bacterium]|nr:glycosyltransferase [bacterium]
MIITHITDKEDYDLLELKEVCDDLGIKFSIHAKPNRSAFKDLIYISDGKNLVEAIKKGCIPILRLNSEMRKNIKEICGTFQIDTVRNKEELKNCIKYYMNNEISVKMTIKSNKAWLKLAARKEIKEIQSILSSPMKENPLVSVVVPTFNRRNRIKLAMESLLDQTYDNFEVIVVDDGSKDGTHREVAEWMKKDSRIKYYYKDNGGCASALNYGISKARGDLISWLSSDDWYEPNMLRESVAAHMKDPSIGMTYTDYNIILKGGIKKLYESYQPLHKKDAIRELNKHCYINGSSMMLKKEVFTNIGKFNEAFRYAQDYDFYYRVLWNYPVKHIGLPLLNYLDCSELKDPSWLGQEILGGNHTNEGVPCRKRYALMFDENRQKVCAMICMKNEEELIGQCLDDLIMYVDYIVILDDGSTDRSVEIAKRYKKVVSIIKNKPKGNVRYEGKDRQRLFEEAKKTKAEWILMIDADEVMEDRFKTTIFNEMKDEKVNMYHYQSHNFWRNKKQYRVDELWYKGWFAKLFRNLPGLHYNTKVNEHCGSVPCNIPDAPQWFNVQTSKKARKSKIRIKHYGYADWNRTEEKYRHLMMRDDKPTEGRHARYDRMVTEDKMVRDQWEEKPYYLENEK